MKIHNVRTGFATNSSSTHSIVFMKRDLGGDSPDSPAQFGWENFTLTDESGKLDYLAATVRHALQDAIGDDLAVRIANELTGARITSDAYVDHQSILALPTGWDGKSLDLDFLAEFKAFLLRDDVAILGGNDNSDGHPLLESDDVKVATGHSGPIHVETCGPVARKDPAGFWTLFNRQTGAKVRISLKGTDFECTPERTALPELVDVKITDYCTFGCPYCYQGSTKKGEHSETHSLSMLAYLLGDARVFEVAIGGGEPTLHPGLKSFVDSLRYRGVVPNLTTKNLAWLAAPTLSDPVLNQCGAFAFSADSDADVRKLSAALEGRPEVKRKATIQYVMGKDATARDFGSILNSCGYANLPVTLLGYKTTGRGLAHGEKPLQPMWIKEVQGAMKAYPGLRIGIDTVLVDRWWDALLAAGVPKWALTRKEGRFSCYVDAVAGKLHASSFTGTDGVPLKPGATVDEFAQAYASVGA